jgi:hypothetical protein
MGAGGILGKLGGIVEAARSRFSRAVRRRSFRLALPVPAPPLA